MFDLIRKVKKKVIPIDLSKPDAVVLVTNERCSKTPFGKKYWGCCAIKEDYQTSVCFQTVDGNDMVYEQPSRCYVNFITPNIYPHTLWIGREIELYEGKLLVGTMVIEEIKNSILDRNSQFEDHQDLLSDRKVLNIALKRSLEWGRKMDMPLDNKLIKSISYLSGTDVENLSKYIIEVRDDVFWKIYYPNWDAKNQKLQIDGMKATAEKYPWINKANLSTLDSQGMYYAWHG